MGKNEADRHNWRDQSGNRPRHRIALGQFEGIWAVVQHVLSAALRALLVVGFLLTPSFLLPTGSYTLEATALIALFIGILTYSEYVAVTPSIIEFRHAPPFNRIRFGTVFLTVILTCVLLQDSTLSSPIASFALAMGQFLDVPFLPVGLMLGTLTEGASELDQTRLIATSSLALTVAFLGGMGFLIALRGKLWPTPNRDFNVWTNLPTLDPTTGGDIVTRLRRDARKNIGLGLAVPFLGPLLLKLSSGLLGPVEMSNQHGFVWMIALWVFVPLTLTMRGVALNRLAFMIARQRRQAYAMTQTELEAVEHI